MTFIQNKHSARFHLRDATAAMHERVDALFSPCDLSNSADYGRFLRAQAAAHLPTEEALERGGIASILQDWPRRRRADLLRNDLAAMGLSVPDFEPLPPLVGTPALLGATYVLEGSRLGGAILRNDVGEGLANSYLSAQSASAWRELVALLDEHLVTGADLAAAVDAACGIFHLFERSASRLLFDKGVSSE